MPKGNGGFFHLLTQIFGHIMLFEKNMENPSYSKKFSGLKLNLAHPKCKYYDPEMGTNFWDQYFEPIVIGTIEGKGKHLSDELLERHYDVIFGYPENRWEINQYIEKYLKIKEPIPSDIDHYFNLHFKSYNIIGVHYRGKDKLLQKKIKVDKVPYYSVIKEIDEQMNKSTKKTKIFVATDDDEFLTFMKRNYPNQILYLEGISRDNKKGIHYSEKIGPYLKGYYALMDCLLLSKTDYLIRTSSTLNLFTCYLNPNLKNKLL